MQASFNQSLRRLLAHEGGYTNHPSDPGGPTNFGITIADYRRYVKPGATAADVRAMRIEEAMAIYRAKYWDALACDDLPSGVDHCVFDYGVNSGIGRSGKVLRRVLGLSDRDWRVTSDVHAALRARAPAAVIAAICDERLRFLQSLRTWPVFGAGWARRVAEVRAFSLALAARREGGAGPGHAGPGAPPVGTSRGKGAVAASRGARSAAAGGAVIASGAVATTAQQSGLDPLIIAALVLAALAAAGGSWLALCWWRRRRQHRALPVAIVPSIADLEV